MGRELKLTTERESFILQAIKAGNDLQVAAGAAGVAKSTFWRWMALGKDDQPCVTEAENDLAAVCPTADHPVGECPELARFRDFRAAVRRTEQEAETYFVAQIAKAAPRDWHAALAIMKAKWPQRWNAPVRTELTGAGGGPIEVAPAMERVRGRVEALRLRALPSGAQQAHDDALDREEEPPHGRKRKRAS